MNIKIIIISHLFLGMLFGSTHACAAESISDRFISLALQGDLSQAESLFTGAGPDHESMSNSELSQRFQSRFIAQSEDLSPASGDALVDAVVSAYREYWILTLMGHLSYQDGEDFLETSLRQTLSRESQAKISNQSANVFELVGDILDEKGIRFLDTPAPPLRDLFLWKTEETKSYTVRLTERTQRVQVTFMSGLYSMGWKQYATLGLVATTGWVEGDRLYCVEWAYDRSSENFKVSYLKHESRHLADFELFPELQSTDLEYRAKLTELIFASTSLLRLLDDFTQKSAPNPASPHAYANYRVTRDVYREMFGKPFPDSGSPWREVSTRAVNAAARDLLQRNSRMLRETDHP
jgi:hypothetical protein